MNLPAFVDQKTKKPSYTLTAFAIGFLIINIKLLFSGVQITENLKMDAFSGVDYGACMAALGGVYSFRKNKTIKSESPEEEK